MQLTLGEVAAIVESSCGVPERLAKGYSIDSRTIEPGALFFAIRGARLDGHQFVSESLERGAVGAVVERAFRNQAPASLTPALLPVADTTEALQRLAREIRRKWRRRLIAVTGSAGKSTTKEMIAALLATRISVLKSPRNLNNDYGLPLTLAVLEPAHQAAVVELAMSGPGEIARLARIAEPEVGVVTNVAPAHLSFFDSVDSIACAKRELIENLKPPGTAVLNRDDERVLRFAEGFHGRVVTFGLGEGADFRATELRATPEGGTEFQLTRLPYAGPIRLPLPGPHNVENALAAIATASLFEIPLADIRQALASFQTLHQRGEILTLPGEVIIIDDSYNSNPRALERMLETIANWPGAKRRILVAGEMLELGPTSPELHREVGKKCAMWGIEWLLAVQGDARYFLDGAAEGGLLSSQLKFFDHAEAAGKFCRELLRPGDVILVKGSRRVGLEKVIDLLRFSPRVASPTGR